MTLCYITDRHRARRKANQSMIIGEAWKMARREGLGAISLSDLAAEVGLRSPSMYSYFESNMELYEAMFADGSRQLLAVAAALPDRDDPFEALFELVQAVIRFSTEDTARHQLLFHRPVPRFVPSPESRALALTFHGLAKDRIVAAGARDRSDLDLFAAIMSGLIHSTAANDSVGDQWVQQARRAVEMYLSNLDWHRKNDDTRSRKAPL